MAEPQEAAPLQWQRSVTILAAIQRAPLWVAVLLLAVAELLRAVPLGR